jgi:hypothetical protein
MACDRPDYRTWLDRLMTGVYELLVTDAGTFFGVELPPLNEWYFTREDARQIASSCSASSARKLGGARVHERVPHSEPCVLTG